MDGLCRFLYNDDLLRVLVLEVSEGRGDDNAVFLLLPITCADTPTAISGIEVIHQSLEANDEVIVLVEGVDIFCSREDAHVILPQVVDEQCGLGSVSPQSGQVFYHDGIDKALFHRVIDFIDALSVEVHAADIVVERFTHDVVALCHGVVIEDLSLIGQGI